MGRLALRLRNRAGRLAAYRWRMRADVSTANAIVIGGCPRSGTTLLRQLLDAHPAVVCGPESGVLLPGRISAEALASAYDLTAAAVSALLATSHSQASFADAFFAEVAQRAGKPRWAEKTPLNVSHLRWIWGHFPKAHFVHVIRDGRDVVCSLREHPIRRFVHGEWVTVPPERSLGSCIQAWVNLTGQGLRWRGDPRYVEVRYEDLVASPVATLRGLAAFLDLDADPDWLAIAGGEATGPHVRAGAPRLITAGSIGRWRSDLRPDEVENVRQGATDRLLELGYVTGTDWS
jgi:protein-tyrosine sulfotransferase